MTQEVKRPPLSLLARIIIPYSFVIAVLWLAVADVEKITRIRITPYIDGAIAALFLSMVASLINILASGVFGKRLSVFIRGMAYVAFIYYVLEAWLMGGPMVSVLPPFFLSGVIISAYVALLPCVKARSPIVLMTALNVATVALLALNVLDVIRYMGVDIVRVPPTYFEVHLGVMLSVGFLLAIISMLVRMLKGSKNTILNAFGNVFPNGAASFLLGTLTTFYFSDIRPLVLNFRLPFEIAEWVTIGLTIAAMYIRLGRKIVPESRDLQLAEWRKHIQVIDVTKDRNFEEVVYLIDTFIEGAKKDPLIVYLAYMLAQRSVPRNEAEKALAKLINYPSTRFDSPIFSWDANYLLAQERSERLKLLKESLELIDNLMYVRPIEVRK